MFFFFQAEDGIRDAEESRGLGDGYKGQLGTPRLKKRELAMQSKSKFNLTMQLGVLMMCVTTYYAGLLHRALPLVVTAPASRIH